VFIVASITLVGLVAAHLATRLALGSFDELQHLRRLPQDS
jgi:ABC-type Fe3+-siderophore transport system permease subunit